MSNSFFQFKQFKIEQANCAMKVTTDACLFGAWSANKINTLRPMAQHILDIGTGTGLLSLMLAQKTKAIIDAIEIDSDAAHQAKYNFEHSPWSNQLFIHNSSIQNYIALHQYDFICINPPFYFNYLKSNFQKKNIALHATALSIDEILLYINLHLKNNGLVSILLPFNVALQFVPMANQQSIYLISKVNVKQTNYHDYFRTMLLFGKEKLNAVDEQEIIIKKDEQYTSECIQLLQPYYLHL